MTRRPMDWMFDVHRSLHPPPAPIRSRRGGPRPFRSSPRPGRRTLLILPILLSALLLPPVLVAQVPGPDDGGVAGVGLLLRQLDGEKRVLMIGAHPDDEDTALLTALARGLGAQTAYLSLTRGEGGQNLIGPELDEGLGIIRTGELEAARRLDGGAQFFTRAFDFGFSKTAEETFGYWPREELLRDVVEVVRRFRPQVIVSVFSGTPRDGHGHHQVAGMVATEAFEASGDPSRFPDQIAEGLGPWQAATLYQRFRGIPDDDALPVPTGRFDPLLGRSHYQLAMESRSQHRSQDMGAAQTPGARQSTVSLVARAPGATHDTGGFFAGVDTTLVGMVDGIGGEVTGVLRALERYREALSAARQVLNPLDLQDAVPPLALALREVRAARAALPRGAPAGVTEALAFREDGVVRALLAAASVVVDVRTLGDVVVPGESVVVEVAVWNGGPLVLDDLDVSPVVPSGWAAVPLPDDAAHAAAPGFGSAPTGVTRGPQILPDEIRRWRWEVTVPGDADPSRLYYLEAQRDGEMYSWPGDREIRGLPRTPPSVRAAVTLTLSGDGGQEGLPASASVQPTARYVGVDKALGEFTSPLLVVPALSVAAEPTVLAWPAGEVEAREVTVRVRNHSSDGAAGEVALEVPVGWSVEPTAHPFGLPGAGAERTVVFRVRPSDPGSPDGPDPAPGPTDPVSFRAVATTESGASFREGFTVITYPHIEPTPLFRPAEVLVPVFPVRVAEGLRVGYVMGSGDDGPGVLSQMGAEVELLTPARVAAGGLDAFDALVLGVRVYEVVPEMAAANDALLEFARGGGTVVVQYNKYEYPDGDLAPWPVRMNRPHDRITDETAPVTLLHPGSPVFTTPNRITAADFEGWVQERGLYFLGSWDDRYVPLLEMADPGEEPVRGGLVVTPVGEGLYIYTGLAFFRQFPAGVSGAYRLFANLVSLRAESWRAHHSADAGGQP